MSTPKFAETHNLVAFLGKLEEINRFKGIIDFLNASSIKYALTLQALVDKKKVIITEKSVRSDLMLEDAEGTECLQNDVIFEQLTLMRRKQRKDSGPTEPIPDEATNEEPISTPSCDPPQSGEDRLQLTGLMNLCTKLQKQVLHLEEAKNAQVMEIASLKNRFKQLEKRRKLRTSGLKRLRKGRKIADLDDDLEVTLIDETQERNDEDLMFDIDVLNGDVVFEEPIVNAAKTTTSLQLVLTLIEIKAAKLKAVTTAATIITTAIASTRPKAKGIIFHDQEEQAPVFTPIKKDQIALKEELALRMHAEEQAKLERMQKERVAQEEATRASIIEELDNIHAMIEADE
ncbi:hypothetical protein Tco_1041984 [Tanacetum coccineum]|uniref:Uncharacterized protein n=1 Tax=Tanacetum coccineum TaxID=301880 RepID=A0ABQ5GJA0_9ASTR